MKKIKIGEEIEKRTLATAESRQVEIPDPKAIVHLQFRRFAGCPFCNVHLRTFVRRHDEIGAAGIREVVVFRSTAVALQLHHGDIPFALIPDPRGTLYTEFGVGFGLRALLDPRALSMALPSIIRMFPRPPGFPQTVKAALGLPADFLISPEGRVLACKYGKHADDQWSVDELLTWRDSARHKPPQ